MTKKIGKERLTITMRKDILSSLDRFIDGEKIRNRSHAIEYIVNRHLGAGIDTCVILAAGQDEQTTKPLLRIHNRPVIAYTIEMLRQAGIYNIVMVINNDRQDIKKYLEDGKQWKVNITYVEDNKHEGTTTSLYLAKDHIQDTFLLLYGDVLAEIDLQNLVQFHKELDQALVTLAVTSSTNPQQYGITELQGNRVYRIIEKPTEYKKSNLVFSGISICEPGLLNYLKPGPDAYIVRDILPDLAHRGLIGGYPFSGKWFDVSHPEEYERARQEWIDDQETNTE